MRKHNNGFMQANNGRKQIKVLLRFFFFLNYNFGNTIFVTSASLKCFNVFHLFFPNNTKAQVKK